MRTASCNHSPAPEPGPLSRIPGRFGVRAASAWLVAALGLASLIAHSRAAAPDILLADFEGTNFGTWKATGTALGEAPARGTLPNQQTVSGFLGRGLANTFVRGDGSTGVLTSPPFVVERRYLNFLIGGGHRPGEACLNLQLDGRTVRTATGNDREQLEWATWDIQEMSGKSARLEIRDQATGGWGHLNVDHLVLSDAPKAEVEAPLVISTNRLYDETYRPQFHFTARQNWLNDPNGLVYYGGEYHLYFQHNPSGINWGNMTWGHAVSTNLVHWTQLEHALRPDQQGTMFSGSAVVDWKNTGGFQHGAEPPLVVFYTAAGGTSPESKGQPFTQCLAFSNDRGRTFTKYADNPVVKNLGADDRDPKVLWHEPTQRWIMALYVPVKDGDKKHADGKPVMIQTIQFLGSSNLKEWTHLSRLDGFFECPDLFELPVGGDPKNTRWVVFGADGQYLIGRFDGKDFIKESGKHKGDWGRNFYAAQTYSDIPATDGRRILIGWMNGGKYPGMPFNQQMAFPCELTLRSTPEGIRLFKWPVREIASLHGKVHERRDVPLGRDNALPPMPGEQFDLDCVIDVGAAQSIQLDMRGARLTWTAKDHKLTAFERTAPLPPVGGKLQLRLLVDRSSVEIFGNQGAVVMSSCFLPRPGRGLSLTAEGDGAELRTLRAWALHSAWPQSEP